MTQERPLLSGLAETKQEAEEAGLKQILAAAAERETLYAGLSVHCRNLSQSWAYPRVTRGGDVQRVVDLADGQHTGLCSLASGPIPTALRRAVRLQMSLASGEKVMF